VLDLVPHRKGEGLNRSAVADFKRKHRIRRIATSVSEDFDAPLLEDFFASSKG
jgi:hypothetical protein